MIPTKKTVKRQIFISSITLSFVLLLVLGSFFTKALYKSELSKAKGQIKQRNLAINLFVETYFSEIKNMVKVIADISDVQKAPILTPINQEKILDLYRSIAKHNKNISYIYTGYDTGLLLIDDWTPQKDYNPVVRPWYQSALTVKPNVSIGLPYQDFNDKEWLISTSVSFEEKHNEIQGVVAIDVSIQTITDLLKQKNSDYKTSYSYVLNEQQEVIIHHNEIYLNKILTDLIKKPVKIDQNQGEFTYTVDTTNKIKKDAYYSKIPSTGWVVVTVVEKSEFIELRWSPKNEQCVKLSTELLKIRPDIPIILCTGFSGRITEEKALSIGIKGFLQKPIIQLQMARMIRKMLDEPALLS